MKKLIILFTFLFASNFAHGQTYIVERVIDGDTIVVTTPEGKLEEVDLIGIDCPESQPNDKARSDAERTGQDLETINRMGQEATEFVNDLTEFCQENKVLLEFDVEKRDKYGRLLAYVFCEKQYGGLGVTVFSSKYDLGRRAMDGLHYESIEDINRTFLNGSIIKSGYATPMTIPPNVKYSDLFAELYEEAREEKRGLWRADRETSFSSDNTNFMKIYVNYRQKILDCQDVACYKNVIKENGTKQAIENLNSASDETIKQIFNMEKSIDQWESVDKGMYIDKLEIQGESTIMILKSKLMGDLKYESTINFKKEDGDWKIGQ